MTYYQDIQKELEEGVIIGNDANIKFTWITFTRGSSRQIHIYKDEELEIRDYKSMKSLSIAAGKLLNGIY